MSKILKFLAFLVVIAVCIILVNLFITNGLKKLELPTITSSSREYGELLDEQEKQDSYEIYTQKLDGKDFIQDEVNAQIDNEVKSFKEDNKTTDKVKEHEKAVYKNIIDTYQVSQNIVSIRVTSMSKKLYEENYITKISTYNYDLSSKQQITLEDLFKSGYKDKIQDVYQDKYLLNHTRIEFYQGEVMHSCAYNVLKDFAKSKELSKDNFEVSQDEYDEIFKHYVDKNKKMVAITFDDGPHSSNTEQILKILGDNNARATFFMLGQNVTYYPEVVKKVHEQGNEIASHTWSHPQLTKLSEAEIKKQIQDTSDAIFNITGTRPKLVRPPYGAINSTVKATIEEPLILWNIDSLDWKSRDENQIVPLVMNSVQDGDIILLHDIHATTVPAVKRIVEQLKAQDYQMVTVSELIEAKGYDTTKTKVFYSGRQ